jgi:hypothetical protein
MDGQDFTTCLSTIDPPHDPAQYAPPAVMPGGSRVPGKHHYN